jgi:hypothetical protein
VKKLLAFNIGEKFWVKENVGITEAEGFQEGIGGIISTLLQNVYVLAGIILLILLIIGGFGFIMGAGGDNPEQAKKGKQAITAALTGFAIIFASYWLIKIIEILTGINILNFNF